MIKPSLAIICALCSLVPCGNARAQSLFQRPIRGPAPAAPAPAPTPAEPQRPADNGGSNGQGSGATHAPAPAPAPAGPEAAVAQVSLYAVTPPKPRTWQKHDKVELIINQASLQKSEQTLKTKKQYDLQAELKQFPSLRKLIQDATLGDGIGSPGPSVDVGGTNDFKGSGIGERKDRFTARISALVLDVRPNGQLVIEARETQEFDNDTKTLVVSGICDPKDITVQGTVLSSQVADLIIRVQYEGDVKGGAKKGWIPRVFDAVFGL